MPSEKYRLYRGYRATATDQHDATDQPINKIHGKLNITLCDALSSPEGALWKAAVEEEIASHQKNGTWELVPLPPGRTPIKSKWIFELKPGYDGVAERYKARLVALGCSQRAGVDYDETFAPVVKLSTLRIMLALVAARDLDVFQLDVKTAFLNGILEEEVYMRQPEGYAVKGRETDVCRLIKSIYGLKQAPRVWNMELNDAIIKYGLIRSQPDPCLYFRLQGEEWMAVLFFVDDAIVCGTNRKALEDFVTYLKKKFELRTLPVDRFLGLTIKRDRSKRILSLSQPDFVDDLVAKFKMESCHPNVIPAEPGLKLSRAMAPKTKEEEANMKKVPYQNAVGALLYLSTTTRPDIAYAVSRVARFNQNPGIQHWTAVKRIIRYLAGTRDFGIIFSPTKEGARGFTDADYGGGTLTTASQHQNASFFSEVDPSHGSAESKIAQ